MKTQIVSRSASFTAVALAICLILAAVPSGFTASQTWSNAPVDATWTNINNWVAKAVPGGLNITGNTVNNDVATFNSPLFSGIGGEANPIVTDNSTVAGPPAPRSRQIGGITFDTANCGSYVFTNPSAINVTDTNFVFAGVLFVSHNGTIQLNAAVTNSQRIMVPLMSRGPSSTDGIYNFVNNAISTAATLYINAATSNVGTTRGTRWILGGSNTGTNTVAAISRGNNGSTTAQGIRKQGTGIWILSGPNEMNTSAGSAVEVNEGTLIIRDPASLGAAAATVTSNAVLQIDGVTYNQPSINLARNGTIRMNGTAAINGVAVGSTVVGASLTVATTSASDVFTVGTGITIAAIVSGGAADTVLNTAGPGTLVFGQSGSQANTYAGRWNFVAKTNQLNSSNALGTGANANVAAGAILDLTPLGATTFAPTTSGLGGGGTGTAVGSTAATIIADSAATLDLTGKSVNLTFTPTAFGGDTTHPSLIIAQGSLTLGGNTFFINNAGGTALGIGTYRLIQQASGGVTDGGNYAALVSGSGTAGGTTASISVSGGNVNLVIAAYVPKNLRWKGGNPDATWNLSTTANFDNAGSFSVFNTSDNVTFDSLGSANSSVTLSGTLAPGSAKVDTTANNYTFSGSGSIAGTTALTKIGTGTLTLQTVNTYAGGTVVSNGTVQVGVNNAISGTGTGDVSVYGNGIIDLNGFNDSINGLNGNGTVDNVAGGASVLTVGNNDKAGTFTGILKNTSTTLGISKVGTNVQVLSASNSYSGPTAVSAGTLAAVNDHALGTGSDVTINTGGTLDVRSSQLFVNSLIGSSGGLIVNNTTAATNRIIITGSSSTTWSGSMSDGTGGGGMALTVLGGTLAIGNPNSYTGGTIVGSGATFNINNSPAGITGPLVASNNATVGLAGGSGTPGTPNSVTTVDGATVTFNGGAEGKLWQCQWNGAVNTTNRYNGPCSFNQNMSFSNFLGRVQLSTATQNFRFNNGGGISGGDNTTFELIQGNLHINGAQTVRLGEVVGGAANAGIGGGAGAGTWILGTKNTSTTFHGYIFENGASTVNLVKSGTGSLTLDGMSVSTNTDSATYTNYLYAPLITYAGSTTVSNGVLALVSPNNLSNSPSITLAASTATLDASQMGYVSNFTDVNGANSVLVTNNTLQLHTGQTLAGFGAIQGQLIADAGSTVSLGLPVGTLAVSGSANLNGLVVANLNRSMAPTAGKMTASSFSGSGATLTVTNVGPNLVTGDVFQLFGGPVSMFTAVNLPASNVDNTISYTWTNMLSVNGSIKVLIGASPVNPTPTNITSSVSGNQLTLSWPASHVGWDLQTNSVDVTSVSSWFTYPGSAATNQVILTIDPTKINVYYRMHLTP